MQSLFALGFRPLYTVFCLYSRFNNSSNWNLLNWCLKDSSWLQHTIFSSSASTLIISISSVRPWNHQPISSESVQINVLPSHALALDSLTTATTHRTIKQAFNISVEFLHEEAKPFPWRQVLYRCCRSGTTPSLQSLAALSYFCAVAESFLLRNLCCNETKLHRSCSR